MNSMRQDPSLGTPETGEAVPIYFKTGDINVRHVYGGGRDVTYKDFQMVQSISIEM
jgi:hypothetical protein